MNKLSETLKQKYQLYKLLNRNKNLSDRRSPMFERNRFSKFLIYFMFLFWAGYLIFIGIMLSEIMESVHPTMHSYHMLNRGMQYLLLVDFIIRFAIQDTPAQEVKPYILMPIGRNSIVGSFLVRSMLNWGNLFWAFLLVPFALLSVTLDVGIAATVGFLLGWWLLIVMNSQFYLLCRTLINEKIYAWILPIIVYAIIFALAFLPEKDLFGIFAQWLGAGFANFNPLSYITVFVAIAALFSVNMRIQNYFIYKELARVDITTIKKPSQMKFLDKFGEIGEYMKLEIKSSIRCKNIRKRYIFSLAFVIIFCLMIIPEDITGFITYFYVIYILSVVGLMTLLDIMGKEGNYLDGLMSRKESILSLLKAKYYFHIILTIIPIIALLITSFFSNQISIIQILAYALIVIGPVYAMLFSLAIFNKKTTPLYAKLIGGKNTNSMVQMLATFAALSIPKLMESLATIFCGDNKTIAYIIIGIIGLAFVITHNLWLGFIYRKFRERRYVNMDGYRTTIENI